LTRAIPWSDLTVDDHQEPTRQVCRRGDVREVALIPYAALAAVRRGG